MADLKRTALYDSHLKWGGKIIGFAGWELPVQYEGLVPEHHAVRNNAGLFDVSHMGEVSVKGKEATAFVQYLVTNDVKVMADNQVIYAQMCYENGGVVDDLLVYKFDNDEYFLVINASNVDKDYAWMVEVAAKFDVALVNLSPDYSELALQGPKAQEILQKLTDTNLDEVGFFFLKRDVNIDGINCLISRTGYTGEDGFEIYISHEDAPKMWDSILNIGKDLGVKPVGLGARDTLRFEATLPLYGQEIDKDISPLEAGLGYFVKLDTDDFIGKDALVKQKAEGLKRKVVGFEMIGKGIPRHEYLVFKDGKEIGVVTTGYKSPTLDRTIGLALVDAEYSKMDEEFEIQIRNKMSLAKVVSKRFYQKQYKK
ncbi:MAG: glycine cleavage system aminomethyltransferase GcvT [Clostridiales bacterium]|nr:glycine cleavage system aminomethyltransferase GcvT [Clostridiales bacterium]